MSSHFTHENLLTKILESSHAFADGASAWSVRLLWEVSRTVLSVVGPFGHWPKVKYAFW